MLNKSLCVHIFLFFLHPPPRNIVQTANRYMPASNPYNPYFGTGLLPMMGHPDHAAASSPIPQAMSLATNAGTQPQKRTVQVMAIKCFSRLLLVLCARRCI